MTFALKDFGHLKKHFNDCVAFVLKRDGKETIAQLPSRRRDELQFLATVIQELETQKITQESVNILYGAMCATTTDIVRRVKSGESTGKVFDRLNIAMGITEANKPDNNQYAAFYKSLNKFLNQIYAPEENRDDSRKAFKKEHPFQSIPAPKLVSFAKIGFELEEAAHNKINAIMAADGKSTVSDGSWYKPTKLVPNEVVAPFGSFAALKEALHQLVIDETADKNAADIALLDPERAAQLQFLEALATSLSTKKASGIKETQKTAILAGAMYLVRGQIATDTYGYEPLSHVDILATRYRNGSVVHTGLTRILNAKTTRAEDTEALLEAANEYIRNMTVESVKVNDVHVESIRAVHLFADIKGFSLVSFFELAQKMIRTCRNTAIDLCLSELNKDLQAQEALQAEKPASSSSSSYAAAIGQSIYSWWSRKPGADAEEEEEQASHAAQSEPVTP